MLPKMALVHSLLCDLQIRQATADKEFCTALEAMEEIVERSGCLGFTKLADKQRLIDSICHYEVIGRCTIAIDQ